MVAAMSLSPTPETDLVDKTLVVWAAPANLEQRAGSALTLDDRASHFDGIVFGELTARKWMAGSDNFSRTSRKQDSWPEETVRPDEFVQIAVVYRGRQVEMYRDGEAYAQYEMTEEPHSFGAG